MQSLSRNSFSTLHHPISQRLHYYNINIPDELWGAAALAVSITKRRRSISQKLQRAASLVIAQAAASFPPPPPLASPSPSSPPPSSSPIPVSIADALDYTPTLRPWEEVTCAVVTAALCASLHTLLPPHLSISHAPIAYAICMTLFAIVVLLILRSWVLERHYSVIQRSEKQLAGPDSKFVTISAGTCIDDKDKDGVVLHYTSSLSPLSHVAGSDDENKDKVKKEVAIHCLHGFGASCFSWQFTLRDMAQRCRAVVTAHDMPGFGLSQRPRHRTPYSLAFNGAAALKIMNRELVEEGEKAPERKKVKRVVIGHSMGAAAAAEGVIRHPQDVSGLVLVAPAIVALWTGVPPPTAAKGDLVARGIALAEEYVGAEDPPGEIPGYLTNSGSFSCEEGEEEKTSIRQNQRENTKTTKKKKKPVFRVLAAILHAISSELIRLALLAATPLLLVFLRRLVRTRSFWERGLACAWSDPSRITREYVDRYRLGQLINGWEYGILRFLFARFSDKSGPWHAIADALKEDGHLSQAERLSRVCRDHNIKVLIVHGRQDGLVPVANSRRLGQVLPAGRFIEVDGCGHMPHEECPELFVSYIEEFVSSL